MKYYKTNNEIRAIEQGQEFLVQEDWILLTDEELQAIINPPLTVEQITAEKVQEAKQYLKDTDYKVLPDYDGNTDGIIEARAEAREFIRANQGVSNGL